jgi:hypothetical protein
MPPLDSQGILEGRRQLKSPEKEFNKKGTHSQLVRKETGEYR